jgi:2-keto-4-pentenoate hydratase
MMKPLKGGGDTSLNLSALSLSDAYLVQDKVAEKRVQKGETVVGYKVGCTSPAIRAQFGLEEPIHGKLFNPISTWMVLNSSGTIS